MGLEGEPMAYEIASKQLADTNVAVLATELLPSLKRRQILREVACIVACQENGLDQSRDGLGLLLVKASIII